MPHRVIVLLNCFDRANPMHCSNEHWLADRDGFALHTTDVPGWTDALLDVLLYG